jgi:hypothetical protein
VNIPVAIVPDMKEADLMLTPKALQVVDRVLFSSSYSSALGAL